MINLCNEYNNDGKYHGAVCFDQETQKKQLNQYLIEKRESRGDAEMGMAAGFSIARLAFRSM